MHGTVITTNSNSADKAKESEQKISSFLVRHRRANPRNPTKEYISSQNISRILNKTRATETIADDAHAYDRENTNIQFQASPLNEGA